MPDLIGKRVAIPRNRQNIRKEAYRVRQELGFHDKENFPIMHVLENILPVLFPEFNLIPVSDNSLPGRMAETAPERMEIRVKESVYDAACRGDAWARMVMAHELGHFILHNGQSTAFAYVDRNSRLSPDVDPERQADIFAAELLIPIHLIKDMNVYQVQKHFGVSRSAANAQMRQAQKVRRRHSNKSLKKEKRLSQNQLNR